MAARDAVGGATAATNGSPGGPRVAVLTMEGTNCEEDIARAFRLTGAEPHIVHLNQVSPGRVPAEQRVELADFDILAIPGGFSAGDYVRAGAIFAARLRTAAGDALDHFHQAEKPIVGICNGFQVLVELGLLPGVAAPRTDVPEAVLTLNESDHYECRPSLVVAQDSACKFLDGYPKDRPVMFPSAHAEGRLVTGPPVDDASLTEAGQVAFRYTTPTGDAEPSYPWNPNGSPGHVAGICDATGTVLGLMPHPERSLFGWQHPDWTRAREPASNGDGLALFQGIVDHAAKRG